MRQNYLTLNKTLGNQILTQSPDGNAAHSVIDKWFTVSVVFILGSPFYFLLSLVLRPLSPWQHLPSKVSWGVARCRPVCIRRLYPTCIFFALPTPSASLPLIYSLQRCWLRVPPAPVSFPCSPAVGSLSAWWTCLPPSLPVCHIPPAGILSGYKVCLAHNTFPLLADGSPQFGQFLEGRKGEGWIPNVLPTDALLSSIQDWLGV